jgi:hypothetical protein
MWEDSGYCWVVLCKNTWFHIRKQLFSSHRIPLGETDAVSPLPALSGPFQVRCDECGAEYTYKRSDLRRYEQELPDSFVPHPLFRPGGDRRRSARSLKQVRMLVRGCGTDAGGFEEKTYAISTSAHGALIGLSASVEVGQRLLLTEPRTQKEMEGRVVHINVPEGGRAEVGVEFLQPSPGISPLKSEAARKQAVQRQAS